MKATHKIAAIILLVVGAGWLILSLVATVDIVRAAACFGGFVVTFLAGMIYTADV